MSSKKPLVQKFAIAAVMSAVIVTGLSGCRSSSTSPSRHVTIGIQVSPAMALVMVAKDKGFFDREGLDVELKEFTAGKFALQAFLGGSLDFAVAGEVPVTLSTLQGSDFVILSQVVERTINEVRVVARRDGETTDARAYFAAKRRKLATSFGGGPEFFTYNFLKKHGINRADVEIISQRPEDMPGSLANGSVDAVSVFDPFAFIAQTQLGPSAIVFADADIYSELYVITAKRDAITRDARTSEGLLRALVQAKSFIDSNRDESKDIVVKYTKLERSTVDGIWANFVFAPALNERLIDYQNQEAAWAKESGAVPAGTTLPDFRSRIYADALRTVAPSAVTISGLK